MKPWWGALAFAMASTPTLAQQFNTPLTPSVAVTPLGSLSFTPTKILNPVDFGAKCDGATDDTAAIKVWLNKVGPGVELRAPAGICQFSDPLYQPYANRHTLHGAGPGATTFKFIGPDYNEAATAAASWAAGDATITLTSAPSIITPIFVSTHKVTAWNMTTGQIIGPVASISGTTVTLAPTGNGPPAGATYSSSGASDAIHLTTDLLTISDTGHGGETGALLSDFNVVSATTLTGGFALRAHGLFTSALSNVSLDYTNNPDSATSGKLCGGVWFDAAAGVDVVNLQAYSTQNCGDAVLVASALGGSAELRIRDGQIGGLMSSGAVSGFVNSLHMGGGFGGLRCDGTSIVHAGNGVLVDNAIVNGGNREFDLGSTCAIDTHQNNGVLINDPLAGGGTINLDGWIASTQAGPGVRIQAWPNGDVELRGHKLYNSCGPGLWLDDASTIVQIASSEYINGNGNSGLGTPCTTWQAGAGAGTRYGVYASASTYKIVSFARYSGNPSGDTNVNSHASSISSNGGGAAFHFPSLAGIVLDHGLGSYASVFVFGNNGTNKWQWGLDSNDHFSGWDTANASTKWLDCATLGICTIGESAASSVITIKGRAQLTGYTIAGLPTCNSAAAGSLAYVSDGVASPAYNAAVSATGAANQLVFCNGSTWTYR